MEGRGDALRPHGQTSLAVAPMVHLKVQGVARANLFARGFPQQEPSIWLATILGQDVGGASLPREKNVSSYSSLDPES